MFAYSYDRRYKQSIAVSHIHFAAGAVTHDPSDQVDIAIFNRMTHVLDYVKYSTVVLIEHGA